MVDDLMINHYWCFNKCHDPYFSSDNRFAKTQPAEPAPTMMWLYSDICWVEVEKARLWELDAGGINDL